MLSRLDISNQRQTVTKRIVPCCGCVGFLLLAIIRLGVLPKTQASEKTLPDHQVAATPTGEINIVTVPPGLDVLIDGEPAGKSPVRRTLSVGQHTYTINAPGREPYTKSVQITSGAILMRKIEFGGGRGNPQPPTVPTKPTDHHVTAVNGNDVRVDLTSADGILQGARLGLYKASDPSTRVGVLKVTQVTDSGSRARIIAVNSGAKPELGDTVRVQPAAAAPTGEINIVTIPPGYDVLIDGEPAGKSPVRRTLSVGQHTYTINAPGREPYTKSVQVTSGAILMKHFDFGGGVAASTGVVLVRTVPPGASLVADGKPLEGRTPFSFSLSVGRHKLVFSLPGSGIPPKEQMIDVRPGDNPVNVVLK